MLKKIVMAVALIALPALGAMAQQKFAHMNAQAVIVEMAEYKKAQTDLETMQKGYQDELQRTQDEFNKKYQEYVAQADSLPRNIAERRQKELQDMNARIQEFGENAQKQLQERETELFKPLIERAKDAIKEVAREGGYSYIFDSGTGATLYDEGGDDIMPLVKKKLGI